MDYLVMMILVIIQHSALMFLKPFRYAGLVRSGIGNDQLQWEVVKKINVGADLAILHERLQFSLDVYHNKTDKLIVYEPTPTASGFDYVVTNSGGFKNPWC